MENVKELMEKYKLSRFIPEDAKSEMEADYQLDIKINLDGTYNCVYKSTDGDGCDLYFMGEDLEVAEGNGYTLDECLHSMRNFIDEHTVDEISEPVPEMDYPFPEKVIDELLETLYKITIAESPGDMWDLAADTLKKYGRTVG